MEKYEKSFIWKRGEKTARKQKMENIAMSVYDSDYDLRTEIRY